jgi:hypothetical protein
VSRRRFELVTFLTCLELGFRERWFGNSHMFSLINKLINCFTYLEGCHVCIEAWNLFGSDFLDLIERYKLRGATQISGNLMPKRFTSKQTVETRCYDNKLFMIKFSDGLGSTTDIALSSVVFEK